MTLFCQRRLCLVMTVIFIGAASAACSDSQQAQSKVNRQQQNPAADSQPDQMGGLEQVPTLPEVAQEQTQSVKTPDLPKVAQEKTKSEKQPKLPNIKGHSGTVFAIEFAPDGKQLVSAGYSDNTIKVWDLKDGSELHSQDTKSATSAVFSPDGKTIAYAEKGGVKLWEPETGTVKTLLKGAAPVTFSPDGKTLACGGPARKKIILWNLANSKEIKSLDGHGDILISLEFSPDGKRLATCSLAKTVKLWDVISGKEIADFKGHTDMLKSAVFSPNGKMIASAGNDSTIKLWNVEDQKEIRTLKGHTDYVQSIDFSPDGKTLASGSSDGTIKIWDVASGKEQKTLNGVSFFDVAFSPNGEILASSSRGGLIKLWRMDSE